MFEATTANEFETRSNKNNFTHGGKLKNRDNLNKQPRPNYDERFNIG